MVVQHQQQQHLDNEQLQQQFYQPQLSSINNNNNVKEDEFILSAALPMRFGNSAVEKCFAEPSIKAAAAIVTTVRTPKKRRYNNSSKAKRDAAAAKEALETVNAEEASKRQKLHDVVRVESDDVNRRLFSPSELIIRNRQTPDAITSVFNQNAYIPGESENGE